MQSLITYAQVQEPGIRLRAHVAIAGRKVSELRSYDATSMLIEGTPAEILPGEPVSLLVVRDFRHTPQTDVFGEFKAIVFTNDYRIAWVMPWQLRVETSLANLSSIRVNRVETTIFIPLPRALWRATGFDCNCRYCSDGVTQNRRIAFFDTMAVSTQSENKHTWTVHAPEMHGQTPLRWSE